MREKEGTQEEQQEQQSQKSQPDDQYLSFGMFEK